MPRKLTKEEFIKKAIEVHGDKYDYSNVEYVNNKVKVKLTCKRCGREFFVSPKDHISKKSGCKYCNIESYLNSKYKLFEEIEEELKSINGELYTYIKTKDYYKKTDYMTVVCNKCGYKTRKVIYTLYKGVGCKKCKYSNMRDMYVDSKEEFIKKARKIHGNKYDYSEVVYINNRTKVKIFCKKCNKYFWQEPRMHTSAEHGCPYCSGNIRLTKEEFIKKAKEIHGDKYDYSGVEYINSQEKVKIKCSKHGYFFQTPSKHLSGQGCPMCNTSKIENDIYSFVVSVFSSNVERNIRNVIYPYELDIFIPDKKLAIEFNGLYWHSFDFNDYINNEIDKNRHLNKTELCENKDIKLLQIFEHEWLDSIKREIWKSIIKVNLGKFDEVIYARKCKIIELNNEIYKIFVNKNHLQGYIPASIKLGLVYNGELVSIISIGRSRFKKGTWELYRYRNKLNVRVIGGFSKLLKYAMNNYSIKNIITYADRRISSKIDNVYLKNGFELIKKTNPNYFYYKKVGDDVFIYSRHEFQKSKLSRLLDYYNEDYTEMWNVLNNGYRVVYDCGNLLYSLTS